MFSLVTLPDGAALGTPGHTRPAAADRGESQGSTG
ncbi:Uncharacterised protein [Tsukamurella paurometabola]|uniref:Uncharacterized protein n=1 Tax=Tsukamurella paurometabola TaxID=2061 RepID=A0A3P8MBI3_TSUPA|nr:Uncharacterised protein [Tsukamurella paurometabola]